MNWMSEQEKSFWHRPLSNRARRVALLVAVAVLILGEGWLGRRRLFILHDRRYLFAFVLYATFEVILLGTFSAVAATKLRKAGNDSKFGTLQVWSGIVCGLAVAVSSVFGDYTVSTLDFVSVSSSVITGIVLGVVMAASGKRPMNKEHA